MTRGLDAVLDRSDFVAALGQSVASTDRATGDTLVVIRAVADHATVVGLLARSVDDAAPVGRLSEAVHAVALIGSGSAPASLVADRLGRAARELRTLSPALELLAVAVSVVEISRYEAIDPETLVARAVEVVEAETLWVERARSACLHLVGAAATLEL